jgi:hypothetical protein
VAPDRQPAQHWRFNILNYGTTRDIHIGPLAAHLMEAFPSPGKADLSAVS